MRWVKPIGTRGYRTNLGRQAASRPRLEPLEDRQLLATCHVVRLGDFGAGADLGGGHSRGDLRYCINKANDEPGADTILLQVSGTINLAGPLPDLASDMEIQGPGSALLTIRRDTGSDYRLVTVAGGTASISGVTLSNGRADVGGGIYNQGTLTLDDVVVNSSTSTGGLGGGIYNSHVLEINNSTINQNVAWSEGGDDRASYGGGIYNTDSGVVTINGSVISNNQATGTDDWDAYGGGINNTGSLSVSYSTITGNTANSSSICSQHLNSIAYGGGIHSEGSLTVESSLISSNTATAGPYCLEGNDVSARGGGINNYGGATATMTNSTIAKNKTYAAGDPGSESANGGGLFAGGAAMIITYSTITGNSAHTKSDLFSGLAGGLYLGLNSPSFVQLQNSIVDGNFGNCPDIFGALDSSGYNLIDSSGCGSGYVPTDILDVDALLGPLQDNGGPTQTMALLPGSPAIDAGDPDPVDPPDWDQRGPGFPRIVNGRIDIGAFEVQATGAPSFDGLAVLVTADLDADDGMTG